MGEAYAILSDPVRRRKFDSGIDESDPMSGHDHHDHGGFGGGFGGGGAFNMEDMFNSGQFGGGGFGGGGGGGRRPYGY